MNAKRRMTPTQRIYSAAEGVVYNRIPPSITRTFPAPAPTFGLGNIMHRMMRIDRPLIVTSNAAAPLGTYKVVGPRQLAGFLDLSKGLPANAQLSNVPPMALVPLPASEF